MTIQTRSMTDSIDSKTKKEKQKVIKKRKKQFTRDRKTERLQKAMKYDEQADEPADEQEQVEQEQVEQAPTKVKEQIDRFRIVSKRIGSQRAQIEYHIGGISVLFEVDWDGENVLLSHNYSTNTCLFEDMTLRKLIHYSFQDVIIPQYCHELDSLISEVTLCQIDIYAEM